MSAYDHVSGGSLKFKGGGSPSIKKKKKKSKSDKEKLARAIEGSRSESGSPQPVKVIEKTEAERKFEEIQRKRQMERVAKAAMKSHKEKVIDFNNKLEQLSEHYDIPKVGPG
ncbi:uncharacterized protein BYT42DRAFT_594784 [Radiomyces spectabilis]|uniref:uncharacterized protein n=1 Tax=Radiomyces spectabilis TaxID=64574 RepID=UPI00221E95A6|nr:uncharacterized protein BYT42DRAFT_594784 [Radiomyces spectabilis]KAI8372886.1 hypothetical protein BYT42DRAFT_594784 [Radiomyces spectabilis]